MRSSTHLWLRASTWLLLAALCAGGTINAYAARKVKTGSKRDAKHIIEDLEEQWRTAQIADDLPAMDRLMADDFVGISITGQANDKAQQLDRFRNRKLIISQVDLTDRKIKLVGSIAIVTSLAQVEGTNEGEPMKGVFRYTRVYQRLPSGAWKTTNFEATRVPEGRRNRAEK